MWLLTLSPWQLGLKLACTVPGWQLSQRRASDPARTLTLVGSGPATRAATQNLSQTAQPVDILNFALLRATGRYSFFWAACQWLRQRRLARLATQWLGAGPALSYHHSIFESPLYLSLQRLLPWPTSLRTRHTTFKGLENLPRNWRAISKIWKLGHDNLWYHIWY